MCEQRIFKADGACSWSRVACEQTSTLQVKGELRSRLWPSTSLNYKTLQLTSKWQAWLTVACSWAISTLFWPIIIVSDFCLFILEYAFCANILVWASLSYKCRHIRTNLMRKFEKWQKVLLWPSFRSKKTLWNPVALTAFKAYVETIVWEFVASVLKICKNSRILRNF